MASRTIRRLLQAGRVDPNPWAPPTAREQHKTESHRQRTDARDVANGDQCGTCGFPAEMPNCPNCPTSN